jgi:hypothetical protein
VGAAGDVTVNNVVTTTLVGFRTLNLSNKFAPSNKGNVSIAAVASALVISGNVTGTSVVNDANSDSAIVLGAPGNGLNTALTDVNVSGFNNTTRIVNPPVFTGIISSAAANSSNVININITGPEGTTKYGAAGYTFKNDGANGTAAAPNVSYGTWSITSDSVDELQLMQGGVGGATELILKSGSLGALTVGSDTASSWSKLTTIDASGSTGIVTVTGSSSDPLVTGMQAGLLAGNTSLTSYQGGSGVDRIDISNMTAAQVGAFKTLDGGAGRDTLLLNAAVLNTTTTLPDVNFETIGVWTGLTGTVDVSKLGSGVDTIQLFGAVAFNWAAVNLPSVFTVALGAYANGFAETFNIAGTKLTDVLTVTSTGAAGGIGSETFVGAETINQTITAAAAPVATTIASITATPSAR